MIKTANKNTILNAIDLGQKLATAIKDPMATDTTSLHHHCTITAPSLHHHCTITAGSNVYRHRKRTLCHWR